MMVRLAAGFSACQPGLRCSGDCFTKLIKASMSPAKTNEREKMTTDRHGSGCSLMSEVGNGMKEMEPRKAKFIEVNKSDSMVPSFKSACWLAPESLNTARHPVDDKVAHHQQCED